MVLYLFLLACRCFWFTFVLKQSYLKSFVVLNIFTFIFSLFFFFFLSSSLRGASSSCGRPRTSWRSSLSSASLTPKTGPLSTTSPGQSETPTAAAALNMYGNWNKTGTGISQQSGNSSAVLLANNYLLEKKLAALNRNDLEACKDDCSLRDKWLQGEVVNLAPYTCFVITQWLLFAVYDITQYLLSTPALFWEMMTCVLIVMANNYLEANVSMGERMGGLQTHTCIHLADNHC